MTTAPFGDAGYRIAYGLAVDGISPYVTTYDQQLTADLWWWYADGTGAGEPGAQFQPGALTISAIDSDEAAVQVDVAHPSSSLASAIVDGSIIGTQAHLLIWAWDAGGTLQYTRDWHMIVVRAGHRGAVSRLELMSYRPWLTSSGVFGLPMLERCPWRYGSTECGVIVQPGGCPKTTTFCKSQSVNLLPSDNVASIETDATGWQALGSGVTVYRSTAAAWHGSASLLVSVDGSAVARGCENAPAGRAPVNPGAIYYASCYLCAESGTPTVRLRVRWYDQTQTLIGTSTEYADVMLSATWQRVGVEAVAPAGAAYASIAPRNPSAVAASWYLDAAMIERSWGVLRPWVPPSQGNLIRYGGLITAPRAGQLVRYHVARPRPAQVVSQPPPPLLPQPPAGNEPRQVRRVLGRSPSPQPTPRLRKQPTNQDQPKPIRRKLGR